MAESTRTRHLPFLLGVFLLFAAVLAGAALTFGMAPEPILYASLALKNGEGATTMATGISVEPVFVPTHVKTPEAVKALYMTSWVAGTPSIRTRVAALIDETEANAIVIDVKDDTGKLAFMPQDSYLVEIGSGTNRISDLAEFIQDLHRRGIYVIGRVAVFQDPHMTALRPDLAVIRESDGAIWRDRKGLSWIDVGAREQWEYAVRIAREMYETVGFDEVNFDYIRFPSDGNMWDIAYPYHDMTRPRRETLRQFFSYLDDRLSDIPVVTSADLFGMTTTNPDDLNIGQVLEDALPYFDYVAPMVYSSHYPPGFIGIPNPAAAPYEVVHYSMEKAVARAIAASTTSLKLRPWLQDFDMGATYDAAMVRAQIQATYDAGLTSWMMWNPSNKYTRAALHPN